jgi:hypothetical protein
MTKVFISIWNWILSRQRKIHDDGVLRAQATAAMNVYFSSVTPTLASRMEE